jgi:glycosyltransferase involved in cell wall biosynthesis
MIKVSALTDLPNTPSSRFRIRAMIPALEQRGVAVTDLPRRFSTQLSDRFFPNTRIRRDPRKFAFAIGLHACDLMHSLNRVTKTRRFDATWISREIVIGHPSWEPFVRQPCYFDIDDAVFLRSNIQRNGIDRLIRGAECVFAGNEFLANYCSSYSNRVIIVPTAVDTERFRPDANWLPSERFKVLWSGTSSSFPYLKAIEATLLGFFRAKPDARLHICSNRYPYELSALRDYIDYEPWSSEAEVEQIQDADVGLMPISDSDWARGKCSYKMLLYAACGVPCIVSNLGMNTEVLAKGRVGIGCTTAEEWRDALESAYCQRFQLRKVFPDGPTVVEQHYSVAVIADIIAVAMGGQGLKLTRGKPHVMVDRLI